MRRQKAPHHPRLLLQHRTLGLLLQWNMPFAVQAESLLSQSLQHLGPGRAERQNALHCEYWALQHALREPFCAMMIRV